MAQIFEQTTINGLTLKNRFVCSALWNGMGNPDGSCSQKMIHFVARPAQDDVGLIVTGAAYVSKVGHAFIGQPVTHVSVAKLVPTGHPKQGGVLMT